MPPRKKLALAGSGLLAAGHVLIHFTVPVLDLILHAAFVATLFYGVKPHA